MQVRVEAIFIETANPAKLAAFYREGLDLPEPQPSTDGQLGFQLGEVYLAFDPVEQPAARAGAVSVWFRVTDAHATFERLLALGARVKDAPQECGGEVIGSVYDQEGNVVGLMSTAAGEGRVHEKDEFLSINSTILTTS